MRKTCKTDSIPLCWIIDSQGGSHANHLRTLAHKVRWTIAIKFYHHYKDLI